MTEPNTERIAAAVALLRDFALAKANATEPIVDFDMGTWHCGTSACALGLFALTPAFQEQGLHLENGAKFGYATNIIPVFEGEHSSNAGALFFGVPFSVANSWFDPYEYRDDDGWQIDDVTPEMVADRMADFL